MPGENGVKVAVEICKRLPNCKILLISGDSGTADVLERAQAEGINFPILAKPVPPEELLGGGSRFAGWKKAARSASKES